MPLLPSDALVMELSELETGDEDSRVRSSLLTLSGFAEKFVDAPWEYLRSCRPLFLLATVRAGRVSARGTIYWHLGGVFALEPSSRPTLMEERMDDGKRSLATPSNSIIGERIAGQGGAV